MSKDLFKVDDLLSPIVDRFNKGFQSLSDRLKECIGFNFSEENTLNGTFSLENPGLFVLKAILQTKVEEGGCVIHRQVVLEPEVTGECKITYRQQATSVAAEPSETCWEVEHEEKRNAGRVLALCNEIRGYLGIKIPREHPV